MGLAGRRLGILSRLLRPLLYQLLDFPKAFARFLDSPPFLRRRIGQLVKFQQPQLQLGLFSS